MQQRCVVHRRGLVDYGTAWSWQRSLLAEVQDGMAAHQVIVLQHPHTFTLGRRGRDEHLLAGEALLQARGAKVYHIDRGGDITFHGPGQLVVYPILDLRRLWSAADVSRYVRTLERAISATLAEYGIVSGCREGLPGVWVGTDKIAAIGVRVSRGVTMHGFALNVATDLSYFDMIVPCGIRDGGVTSMERLLGAAPTHDAVGDRIVARLTEEFALDAAIAEAVAR